VRRSSRIRQKASSRYGSKIAIDGTTDIVDTVTRKMSIEGEEVNASDEETDGVKKKELMTEMITSIE
jgi:hypothetical protein